MKSELLLYTGNRCQYCAMAKGLLKQADLDFAEVNIDENDEYKRHFIGMGFRAIPVLFKGDTCIAYNYNEIERYVRDVT